MNRPRSRRRHRRKSSRAANRSGAPPCAAPTGDTIRANQGVIVMTTAHPSPADIQAQFRQAVRDHWILFLILGVVMVILGLLAFAAPVVATLAVDFYVGWLFLISGVVGVITLFMRERFSRFLLTLFAEILTLVVGELVFGG